MNPERIIAGLDIGSAKTTAVIAEATGDGRRGGLPTLRILGVGQARTTGLRRGIVSDIEETTRSIKKAIEDAERMAGTKIDTIYAGIAGEHVRAMISKGIVAVNGEEISKADVDRATEVARAAGAAGPGAAARHSAGVLGRQESGDSRSDRNDRHAPRD